MFHVELRQFPNVTRAFNLSREQLMARILAPWVAGEPVAWGERRWNPQKAKIFVYEGRALEPAEIGLGRGWANATRTGTDVTDRLLQEARVPPPLETFKRRLADRLTDGALALSAVIDEATQAHPQARLSERLALAEQAVWQLLHEHGVELERAGEPVGREAWEATLLSWQAWAQNEVSLRAP